MVEVASSRINTGKNVEKDVSGNGLFPKLYIIVERGDVLLESRELSRIQIYNEFSESDQEFWFGYRQKKFLHNIDTFYYSVKLLNDFTVQTEDPAVLQFRKSMEVLRDKMGYRDSVPFYLDRIGENMNLLNLTYGKFYNVCLECPEYFHVFIASKVPPGAGGTESVTCEIIVQLRSYMLWMYGVNAAFEESLRYVQAFVDQFGFEVAFVQENRIDYCWHSNYLQNPEKFFAIDNFYKMRVDRYRGANYHTAKVGSEDYEVDYVSLGNRGGKHFVRIYLKSKEVVEEGYKAFFLKLWLFQGLISRYDLYCYELAYARRNWQYLTIARMYFYLEYGSAQMFKETCKSFIHQYDMSSKVTDAMMAFANSITPKIHLVTNVEYQEMRKASKYYPLVPFSDNRLKGAAQRIYDYFDNRQLIAGYLTHDIFRLVEPSGDSNKSRRDYCGFWRALRATKTVDVKPLPKQLRLVRDYHRQLNKDAMKKSLLNKVVTYGIYMKGINDDGVMKDAMDALLKMNDNDLVDALRYKKKKVRQFNPNELAGIVEDNAAHDFILFDRNTGAFYDDTISSVFLQDKDGGVFFD